MNFTQIILDFAKWQKYLAEHSELLIVIVVSLFFLSVLSSKVSNKILLILYLIVILYMTLLNRNPHSSRNAWFRIFATYQYFLTNAYLRREILNNIILFIPLGTIVARLWPRWRRLIVPVMVSVAIELLQFITKRGFFETDDIISNSIGGIIGFSAAMLFLYAKSVLRRQYPLKKKEQ